MNKHLLSVAIGLGLLVGGCTTATPAAKPANLPAKSFASQWRAELGPKDGAVTGVHVADEWIFAYTDRNVMYAMNRGSGRIAFIGEVVHPPIQMHAPVVLKDYIVIPTTQTMEVYNRKFQKLRSFELPFALRSGAVGAGTHVYAGADYTGGGRVAAFNIEQRPYTSTADWMLLTFGGISGTPALYQGLLYAGSRDGNVYACRAEDRASIWPQLPGGVFKTGRDIVASLKADKDGVYVASMDSKLYCLDLTTGRIKWEYYSGQALAADSEPVITLNTVYVHVAGKGVVAIDKTANTRIRAEKWAKPVADSVQFLSEDDKYVYLLGKDRGIMAVDKQSGAVEFSSKRKDLVTCGVNTKDGTIYAATAKGDVLAIVPVLKVGAWGELVLETRPVAAPVLASAR